VLPLRVCVIASYPPVRGGEAIYVRDFVRAMANYFPNEIGEIFVLTHSESKSKISHQREGKININRLYDSSNFLARNFAFLKIFCKIITIKPNVIQLEYSTIPNGRYGGLLGESLFLLFLLLKPFRIPIFITQHSVWLPQEARERIYEKTGSKFLSLVGAQYLRIFTHLFSKLPKKLFILVNFRNSRHTTEFSQAFSIPPSRIVEEPHGVWVDRTTLGNNPERGSRSIVCLGVLNPSKGYEFMIGAMRHILKEFPDASLLIAGSSPPTNYREGKRYIEKLCDAIAEYGLNKSVVIKDEYISDEQFVEYIRTAGIVALPYSKVVGASSIMHLAMRFGVPLIAAGSGLLFDELADFIPVVPPKNMNALARSVIDVFKESNSNIHIENYKRYLEIHDWRMVSKAIFEEYVRELNMK
jgi:glycosyltransferase involved in cell wall biosynthesis